MSRARGRSFPALRRTLRLLLALVPALAGCVDERQEQELGDTIALQIRNELPLVQDPLLNRYVTRVGQQIVQVSDRPDVPYRFNIINSPEPNAFALPGGHIYVTRGLIERTDNVSELAGVLAHEIAHVAARHGVEKLERQLRTRSLVTMLYNLLLGGEPGLLQQEALALGGELWYLRNSRDDEREADDLAVDYLVEAGVDPIGMITLMESLLQEEAQPTLPHSEWFSTHPLTQNRIVSIRDEIHDAFEGDPEGLVRDLRSYPAFLSRVGRLPEY